MSKSKNKTKKPFLDSKRNVWIISITIALVAWVIVALFINPNQSNTLDININYNSGSNIYANLGLEIVGARETSVAVTVNGDGSVINDLGNDDIQIVCDYSKVTSPGTYTIPLRHSIQAVGNITVVDIEPKSIELTFEAVSSVTLQLAVDAPGITVPDGYYLEKDPEVNYVTVRGPESDMARVKSAAILIDDEEERTTDYLVAEAPVQLLDENGMQIVSDLITIDPAVVNVDFRVLLQRDVPIDVNLVGAPPNFDTAWFKSLLTYSESFITVAGNEAALEQLSSTLTLGSVDVSTFWLDDNASVFAVSELPANLRNLNKIQQIEVTLNTEGLAERTMEIPRSDISVLNMPNGLTVTPSATSGGDEVTLVGPEDTLLSLNTENVVVEIDASRVTAEDVGTQVTLSARVYVPRSNRIYAVGSYEIVCRVAEE